jgi:hypothetical protein
MSDSSAKNTRRKTRRTVRRRGRRGSSQAAETASSSQAQQPAEPTTDVAKNGSPQLSNGEEVSSLLASTSQEVQQLLEAADDAAAKIREAAQTEDPADGGQRSKGKNEVSSLLAKTSEEVQQVLESADEAAEKIRAEARAEARQFLDESRRRVELVTRYQMDQVAGFTEQVLGEAAAVQSHLEALRDSFERATAALDTRLSAEKAEIERPEDDGEQSDGEQSDGEQSDAEDLHSTLRRRMGRRRPRKIIAPKGEPAGEISEAARLLALRQIMAGEDSEDIEARLRDDLGIEDPAQILEWMSVQESDR